MKAFLPALLLVLFLPLMAFSQERNVSGKVTSLEDNSAIPGVNILIKGTTNGTVTDVDGNYKITLPNGTSTLVFSSIGYTSEEVVVSSQSVINIELSPDIQALSEVVVVGYGTQKKSDLTGAVVSAPLESFQEAPNTNILQSLSGSVPGVSVPQTQFAGEEPDINIRGRSTINGAQNPLIVLDGIIYRGRVSDLNPKDIKSIDILKDASSKAIYGAQAANGVVLITTKKGSSSETPTISYSGYYSTQAPANELHVYDREGFLKKARDVVWFSNDPDNGVVGPFLPPEYTQPNPAWNDGDHIPFTAELLAGYNNGTDFNWYDEVTDPGFITDHQLSIQSSTKNTSYYISGGYTKQVGWMLNDEYDRKTVRVNVDTDITDWLAIGANTFGAFSDLSGQSPNLGSLPMMSPLAAPRDENGELIVIPVGNNQTNPLLSTEVDDLDKINNISAIFYADVTIPQIKGLNYRLNFSNNYRTTQEYNSNIYGGGLLGSAFKRNGSTYDVMIDNIITYGTRISDDHGLNFTFVYGWNKISGESTLAEGNNYSNLGLSYNDLGSAVIKDISSTAWEESYLYQMARVNYDYKNKYFLTATVRNDGFSGFSENNKTGLFPSIGAGWTLSKEPFLNNSSLIDQLKLRASYGTTGNLTGRYSSLAVVSTSADLGYVYGDGGSTVNGQSVTSLQNNDLSWEKTTGINLGLDFGLFNSRITGSMDYYQSTTTDLLWDLTLPVLTGFNEIRTNLGKIANSGFEMLLNANVINTGDFNWNLTANFTSNNNEIQELIGLDHDGDGREDDLISANLFIGESIGSIYNYEIDRMYQIGDDIPDGYFPGSYKFVDQNGDGEIDPANDRVILGRNEPAYILGFQNTLSYKNFTLKFFIKSIQGGKNGYMDDNNPNYFGSTSLAQNNNWYTEIDYWSPSNPDALYPAMGRDPQIQGTRYFQRNFVRLQDISLSYTLPENATEAIGLKNVKLFVSGKNLLTITDWQGWDPESGQGLNRSSSGLPLMKGYTFGIDISL